MSVRFVSTFEAWFWNVSWGRNLDWTSVHRTGLDKGELDSLVIRLVKLKRKQKKDRV